jgi:hypothetical protein
MKGESKMNEQKIFQSTSLVPYSVAYSAAPHHKPLSPEKVQKISVWYTAVLASLILALIFSFIGYKIQAKKDAAEQMIRKDAVMQYQAQVKAEEEQRAAEKMEETITEAMLRKQEIEMITRLFEGIRNFNYDMESLMTYGWCAYNRKENANYGDTLYDVIHQEGQWTGYSDDLPIVKDYYRIAEKLVDEVYNGEARPCTPDFVIAILGEDGIYLRTSLENSYSSRSWHWGW